MPTFADYQPSERGLSAPDDLAIVMADQRHASGVARLYSDRELVSAEEAGAWAQRAMGRISEKGCVWVASAAAMA